jgi:RNA polymerase sigma factor (sigma-70 family)
MNVLLVNSLEEIFRNEHERLWKSLVAFTGDADLASEAEAETFSQAVARGDELHNPQAWIWRTAFKVAAGLLADRQKRSAGTVSELRDALPEMSGGGDPQLTSSLGDFLDLLHSLSEQQRTVVILRYAAGFMPTEIAQMLETTPGTVRVQLHRAHQHLRERIGNE